MLQPSHNIDGTPNPLYFLDHGLPKVSEKITLETVQQRAASFDIDKILFEEAPIIDPHGEVVRGNLDAAALKLKFEQDPQWAEEYYKRAYAEKWNVCGYIGSNIIDKSKDGGKCILARLLCAWYITRSSERHNLIHNCEKYTKNIDRIE